MRTFIIRILIITTLILTFSGALAEDNYTLDPNHSYVLWHVNHFGFSNPSGKWMVSSGTLVLDEAKPQNSKVNVTIDMADIDTGIPKLDEHLKTDTFFNVVKFPIATFVSNSVDVTGKDTALVHGILTVHGVAKPITLNVTLNKLGISPITNKMTAGFTATAELKRSDYGITAYLPGLGDDVKIDIEAEAYK